MRSKIITLILCCSTVFMFGQNRIQKVDPPNWWVGMKHHTIQLLIYGDNVGDLKPKINSKDVKLRKAIRVENPNYLFVDIEINDTATPGAVGIDFYQNGEMIETYPFEILAREEDRSTLKGFDASDAIYLITPDRFVNGDETNDTIEGMRENINRSFQGGRHGGDIEGIRKSLDYIKNLGFTAIWLNPLLENDMEEYSYHGYSTTDFYKVDPHYGTNADYKRLADEARSKGMDMIMDMIVNHCGSFHWWMEDPPMEDWINQWEEKTYTNHRKTVLQDPYVSELDLKVFADGWFVETMPDLNQRNEFMATYLTQNGIWWVEYLGLAGIRMDTYPYPDMDYMTDWTKALMIEYPDLNIVGEEWYETPVIVSYWQKGKYNPNGYTSDLRSLMDFPLQVKLTEALNDPEGWKKGWIGVYELLATDFLYPDPFNLVIFPDNHDMSRIFTQINEDYDLFKMAMAFYSTMRGIPQIYYGTEILMHNRESGAHGIIRSDYPGGWKGDPINAFTGEGLTDLQIEAREYTRKLLTWRKNANVIHTGKLKHFLPQDGVYVYFRYNENGKVMIIMNKNDTATMLDLDRFSEILGEGDVGEDIFSGSKHSMKGIFSAPPKQATILEIR